MEPSILEPNSIQERVATTSWSILLKDALLTILYASEKACSRYASQHCWLKHSFALSYIWGWQQKFGLPIFLSTLWLLSGVPFLIYCFLPFKKKKNEKKEKFALPIHPVKIHICI